MTPTQTALRDELLRRRGEPLESIDPHAGANASFFVAPLPACPVFMPGYIRGFYAIIQGGGHHGELLARCKPGGSLYVDFWSRQGSLAQRIPLDRDNKPIIDPQNDEFLIKLCWAVLAELQNTWEGGKL